MNDQRLSMKAWLAANYYQVGGSLSHDRSSYVKRAADEQLYQGLKNGEFCCVFNARQMGKSSLRVQVRRKLEQEGIRCTAIDMTTVGSNDTTAESFYAGITIELWSGFLNDPAVFYSWWEAHKILSPLQRLSLFIEQLLLERLSEKIVIFIDEIDNLINRDIKDEFLEFIRACYNYRADKQKYRRVTFCLLGVVTPSDLKDKGGIPFNIGRSIELTGFSIQEAETALTAGLALKVDAPQVVLQQILNWTGGQPFLTQKLCKLILDQSEDHQPNVDELVKQYIIENWQFHDEPEHLRTIRNRLLFDQSLAFKQLNMYKLILQNYEIVADDDPHKTALRLSGLVVKQQGKLQVCNHIYKNVFNLAWVEENLNLITANLESSDINSEIDSKSWLRYTVLVPIAVLLAAIALVSIGFSYIFVESQPWSKYYNQNNLGIICDGIRICFLLILEVYIIGSDFSQDVIQLIKNKKFYLRRRITYMMSSLFVIILLFHHLWYGPHNLLGNDHVTNEVYFKQYLLPYILYFPYSFINFIVVGIPLSISSIHVAIEDCRTLIQNLEKYRTSLDQIVNKSEKLSLVHREIDRLITIKLNQVNLDFYVRIKRSVNLLLGIMILFDIDNTLARSTFSNGGYIWTQLFCLFGIIIPAVTIVLWGLLAYQKNLEKTIEVLFGLNYDFQEIDKKYNTFKLLQRIFISNLFFRIICLLYLLKIIHIINI